MKQVILSLLGLIFLNVLFASCVAISKGFEITELTCDYYKNPIGIENPKPCFSWIVEAEQNNQSQSAYQLLVSSTPEKLNVGDADLWDSGKVNSSQSVFVPYLGKGFSPMSRYFWKVKIWNQNAVSSEWSPNQFFETGLMNERNWSGAKWIEVGDDNRDSPYRFREVQNHRAEKPKSLTSFPSGYFRKEFKPLKQIIKAEAYISGLGYFDAFLNGKKIGDHVLDPSATSYDDHAYYVVHDVTPMISKGQNAFGILLGNGFYGQNISFNDPDLAYGKPAVKVLLKIYYTDNSSENIITDNTWKVNTGPIVFDNVYAGETYDARYEQTGWEKVGFDDSKWANSLVTQPVVGELKPQLMPAIRKIKTLDPVRIFKAANGNWIIDFGQNISGWVKIKVKEKVGQEIKIMMVEALTRKGDSIHTGSLGKQATGVLQEDIYICKGGGTELWEPRFTYHGFQFAEISGLSKEPSKSDFQAVLVHTDLQETGNFGSSDEMLNKMLEVSRWTVVDNLHSFPEDCPHREKCGWLGDAQVVAQFCLYNYNIASFYEKYMLDIQSQLTPVRGKNDKENFFKVPTMVAPGKRKCGIANLDWGVAEIYLPWYNYLHNGDFRLVERHYPDMKELVAYYLSFKNDKGIIENGLGDWCPPFWDRANNPGAMECQPFISASAYFYDVLGIMQRFAEKLNEPDYASFLKQEREKLGEAFNQQFLQDIGSEDGKWYGSQTATVLALQLGMVPDSLLDHVKKGLMYDIVVNKKEHHSTGIHGNRYIYSLLNDLGEEELSYKILTNPEFPSQAYILNCGLTTWPERQWEWGSGIEWDRSLNHPMQAGFAAYFYESVAGIKPMADYPGFKEFTIEPFFLPGLEYANAVVKTPYGKILVDWKRQGQSIVLNVNVPFNTKARLKLPLSDLSKIEINGKPIADFHNQTDKIVDLGSGTYNITFQN